MTPDLFLALVRSGLYARPLAADEQRFARQATAAQWAAVVTEARRQTVLGQIYQAVLLLPSDIKLPDPVIATLFSDALRAVRQHYRIATETTAITERFREAGLSPVVMKGISVARFYPHPEFRALGDIDLYLPKQELPQALPLLEDASRASDGSLHGRSNSIDIDLHDRYFDLHCASRNLPEIGTPEATLLMLSAHILKHAIGPGVGMRQLCDMAMVCRGLSGSFDPVQLRAVFRRTGTLRWNRLLFSFLVDWLGLEEPLFARIFGSGRVSSAPLLQIVLEGGNFGHFAAGRLDRIAAGASHRKRDTLQRFLHRLPFSLRYAPRETFATIVTLLRGNLRTGRTGYPHET